MTIFLRDSSPRRIIGSRDSRRPRLAFALGVIGVVAFLFFGRYFLSTSFVALVSPLWTLERAVQEMLAPLTASWANAVELQRENTRLLGELRDKNLEIQRLALIIDDYEEISGLFTEKDLIYSNSDSTGHLAAILARPPVSPFDTLVLSIDETSKAREGDLVYAPGGILLGELEDLSGGRSKAVLYSAPGEVHNAFIKGVGPIELRGQGGGNFETTFPKNTDVPQGALITLEGRDSILAKVGTTTVAEGDSFQKIYAALPISIQSLQWVRIIPRD